MHSERAMIGVSEPWRTRRALRRIAGLTMMVVLAGFVAGCAASRAMSRATRDVADAIVISMQAEGGQEIWLGLASRRVKMAKVALRVQSKAREFRIGWSFQRSLAKSNDGNAKSPFPVVPIPSGKVTFRAYALEMRTGRVERLPGEFAAIMPTVRSDSQNSGETSGQKPPS